MSLDSETVLDIARLARLGVHPEAVEKMRKDLSRVIDFFEEIEKSTLTTVGEESDNSVANRTRPDQAEEKSSLLKERIRKNFPDAKEHYLKVKSIFSV